MEFDLATAPGHLIRIAQQRHQALWTAIVGGELTSVQFAILVLLRDQPELDQRTLAARAFVDTSTLADVCRRLEQRGLLRRARDADDGRRYVLRVTPEGDDVLRHVIPDVRRVGEALLDGLGEAERASLLTLLRKLI
jgi:DNA-binding MarR family transcriptional regulator